MRTLDPSFPHWLLWRTDLWSIGANSVVDSWKNVLGTFFLFFDLLNICIFLRFWFKYSSTSSSWRWILYNRLPKVKIIKVVKFRDLRETPASNNNLLVFLVREFFFDNRIRLWCFFRSSNFLFFYRFGFFCFNFLFWYSLKIPYKKAYKTISQWKYHVWWSWH